MPTRDSTPFGAPCWNDLASSDPDRSTEFYRSLFGWTAEQGGEEYGGYVTYSSSSSSSSKDGSVVAGMMKNEPDSGLPDVWSTYLCVEDAAGTVEAARAAGSHVAVEAMECPTRA